MRCRRLARLALATGVILSAAVPAWSATGRVHDSEGRPIVGASACVLLAPDTLGLCTRTNDQGYFSLPTGDAPGVRIAADGFLAKDIGAIDHEAPVVLDPAASFELRVVDDADGRPVPGASVWIVSSDGRRRGPIDLSASGWLQMKTFPPGSYRFQVEASGYVQTGSPELRLGLGTSASVEVRMHRTPPSSHDGLDGDSSSSSKT